MSRVLNKNLLRHVYHAVRYNAYMARRYKKGTDFKVYRFDSTCEGKRFFASEAKALEAAEFQELENMNVTIGVYQCPTCRNWHLTSLKSTSSQA